MSNREGENVKHFLVAGAAACAVLGALVLGPAGGSAAVRHIAVDHSPAPPLTTVEISSGTPTPAIGPVTTPPANAACTGCPQNNQTNCTGCPPQTPAVQLNLVQVPL